MNSTNGPILSPHLPDYESQILSFNEMYKLPVAPYPSTKTITGDNPLIKFVARKLEVFKSTLLEKVEEADAISYKMQAGASSELEFLTEFAKWIGDIQIDCASEMAKYGIPLKETLSIILVSHFSKLDESGMSAYGDNGRIEKGPYYIKPEREIEAMLRARIFEAMKDG